MEIFWKWKIYEEIHLKYYKTDEYEYDDDDCDPDYAYEEDNDNTGYEIWGETELNRVVKRCDTSC